MIALPSTAPVNSYTTPNQYYGCYETAVKELGKLKPEPRQALLGSIIHDFSTCLDKERLYITLTALLEVGVEKEYLFERALLTEDLIITQLFTLETAPTRETLIALATEHELPSLRARLLKPGYRLQFEEEAKGMCASIERDPTHVYKRVAQFYDKFPDMGSYKDPVRCTTILQDAVFTYLQGCTTGIFEAVYFLNKGVDPRQAIHFVNQSRNQVIKELFKINRPTYADLCRIAKEHPFADRELVRWIDLTEEAEVTEKFATLSFTDVDDALMSIRTLKDSEKRKTAYLQVTSTNLNRDDCIKVIRTFHATDGNQNWLNDFCYNTASILFEAGDFIQAKEALLYLVSGLAAEQARRDLFLIRLAEHFFAQKQFKTCFECISPIKPWNRLRHDYVLKLGQAYIESTQLEEALKIYRAIDDTHFAEVREDCLKELAGRCITMRAWDTAAKALLSLLHDEHGLADLIDQLVDACLATGDSVTAATLFSRFKRAESDYAKLKIKETASRIFVTYLRQSNEEGAGKFLKTMVYTHLVDEFAVNGVTTIFGTGLYQTERTRAFAGHIVDQFFDVIKLYFVDSDRESAVHDLRMFIGKKAELDSYQMWLFDSTAKKDDQEAKKLVTNIVLTILETEFRSNGVKAEYRRQDDYSDRVRAFASHLATTHYTKIVTLMESKSKAIRMQELRNYIHKHASIEAFNTYCGNFNPPPKSSGTARQKAQELSNEIKAAFKALDLPTDAMRADIRKNYKLYARTWHPDHTKPLKDESEESFNRRFLQNQHLFAKASAAYALLQKEGYV
ncbi:MAG: J domain-containing protein [Verrucomicrobia bacterium]|nr:J domain-containing protein [Verrucomicrobiota bacterium]